VLQRKNVIYNSNILNLPLPLPKGDIPLWRGQGEVWLTSKTISIYSMI
jgi:hypothetical protein